MDYCVAVMVKSFPLSLYSARLTCNFGLHMQKPLALNQIASTYILDIVSLNAFLSFFLSFFLHKLGWREQIFKNLHNILLAATGSAICISSNAGEYNHTLTYCHSTASSCIAQRVGCVRYAIVVCVSNTTDTISNIARIALQMQEEDERLDRAVGCCACEHLCERKSDKNRPRENEKRELEEREKGERKKGTENTK